MICQSCGDKGIIRLPWTDAPDDYAICLCPAARWYRSDDNAGRHTGYFGWQVWAYRHQVDPSRVWLMEEALTSAELSERGFVMPVQPTLVARETALLEAGKSKRVKL